ncbi:hypothetical protein ACQP1V_22745 [Microtetraspora malaysiensis]|uniref:hypothetical protein n=1 Tax=Microtetraspora malaysiensis TaxID=161358 RepID=UPI003D89BF10
MSTRRSFLLPPRATTTGQLLAEAAVRRGMDVRTLPGPPIPTDLRGRTHLYGGERFADAVASALDMALVDPPLDLLAALPANFTGGFSNAYAADAERVLDVVMRTAGPAHEIWDTDRPFVRRTAGIRDDDATRSARQPGTSRHISAGPTATT